MNTATANGAGNLLRDQNGSIYQVCFEGFPASGSFSNSLELINNNTGVTITPVFDGSCVRFEVNTSTAGQYTFQIGMDWRCGGTGPQDVTFLAVAQADSTLTDVEYTAGNNGSYTPTFEAPCGPYTLDTLNDKDSVPSWVTFNSSTGQISWNPPAGEVDTHFLTISCQGIEQKRIQISPPADFEANNGSNLNNLKKEMPWGPGQPINGEPQYYSYAGDTGINGAFTSDLGYNPHVDEGDHISIEVVEADPAHRAANRLTQTCDGQQATHVSGVLTTEDIFEATEARFEVEVRFPVGNGYFGGFWPIGRDTANPNEGPPPEYGIEWNGAKPTEIWFNIHHPTDGDIPPACVAFQAAKNPPQDPYELYSLPWNHSPNANVANPAHPDYNPCEAEKHTNPPPGGWRPGGYQYDTLPDNRRIDQWNKYAITVRGGRAYFEVNGHCMADGQSVAASVDAMELFPILNFALSDPSSNCGILNGFIDPLNSQTGFPAKMGIRNLKVWRYS